MEIYIIFGIILCLCVFLSFFLGKKINQLEHENEKNELDKKLIESNTAHQQLKEQFQIFRVNAERQLNDFREEKNKRIITLENNQQQLQKTKEELSNALTQKNTEYRNLQINAEKQKNELENFQQKFKEEFENLAQKILEQKSERFTSLNKNNIQKILTPLQERIKTFEEKVELNAKESIQRHSELGEKLKQLNAQNLKISEEATNLTKALKGDSRIQGNWGELILERVLEQSGLVKDREYFEQKSFTTENQKKKRPDIIVVLPGNKRMIVDSKVSLTAYEQYMNSVEKKEKKRFLKQHLHSIKKHINDLSSKNYHEIYDTESPDFVLLFIPVEPAFALASKEYPNLYTEAFEKNIILVTPTTLLAVLRTIENMWQNENQKKNALQIAKEAGKLHDTFVNLIEEMEKVGLQMDTAKKSYNRAMKKLTGNRNLIKNIQKLKQLGAKTNKQINSDFIPTNEKTKTLNE